MTFIDASTPIATHAAITQSVHGVGAGNTVVGDDELLGYGITLSNNYTGNNGVNRAIPHGLGRTPKYVLIHHRTGTWISELIEIGKILGGWHGNASKLSVTSWDSTNFYVGNASDYTSSANATTIVYDWVAFG